MHTLKTMGVIGTAAAILLSASVVFAEERAPNALGENRDYDSREAASSTTARMQAAREEAQARMQAQRDKAVARLADIQNSAKQETAKRIAAQFDNLNKTWTDHFMNLLGRYDAILQKMQARADTAAGNGKDATAANAAIQSAKTAVANVRIAVIAQAAKTYVLDTSTLPTTAISTPSGQEKIMQGLRKSFQTIHTALFKDMFALRDGLMKDARKAVQDALQALTKIPGVDDEQATSASGPN